MFVYIRGNQRSVKSNHNPLNFSLTSSILPQVISPSVQGPATQFGPDSEKIPGRMEVSRSLHWPDGGFHRDIL